ncbi:hypothetical protein GGR50DRAFT_609014 [Xylaria sp. CBS 124048]|nr:hypothetical protein GGR50DRAFT_609014 [Xylaria sp. CBS 124048]
MAQEQMILPKGIVLNANTVYDEIAKFDIIPVERILRACHVFTTTSRRLYDPTARRLENFWTRVLGGDRRYLSGRVIAQLFKEISEETSFVKLRGPRNRYEPPSSESSGSRSQHKQTVSSNTPKPKGKAPIVPTKTPHPILKKPRRPSATGPRPTARFASPPDLGSKRDGKKTDSATAGPNDYKSKDPGASTTKEEKRKAPVQKSKKTTAFVASTSSRRRPGISRKSSSQYSTGLIEPVSKTQSSTGIIEPVSKTQSSTGIIEPVSKTQSSTGLIDKTQSSTGLNKPVSKTQFSTGLIDKTQYSIGTIDPVSRWQSSAGTIDAVSKSQSSTGTISPVSKLQSSAGPIGPVYISKHPADTITRISKPGDSSLEAILYNHWNAPVPKLPEEPEQQPTGAKNGEGSTGEGSTGEGSTGLSAKAAGKRPAMSPRLEKPTSKPEIYTRRIQPPEETPIPRQNQPKYEWEPFPFRSGGGEKTARRAEYNYTQDPSNFESSPCMNRSSSDTGPNRSAPREANRGLVGPSSLTSPTLAKIDTSVEVRATISGFSDSIPIKRLSISVLPEESDVSKIREISPESTSSPGLYQQPTPPSNAPAIPLGRTKSQLSVLLDRPKEKKSKR